MMKIISYLSEHLYMAIVVATIIALIVFYIIGSIKMKKKDELINEERKKNEIKAPVSQKRFVQGEKIEKQKLYTNDKEETENE